MNTEDNELLNNASAVDTSPDGAASDDTSTDDTSIDDTLSADTMKGDMPADDAQAEDKSAAKQLKNIFSELDDDSSDVLDIFTEEEAEPEQPDVGVSKPEPDVSDNNGTEVQTAEPADDPEQRRRMIEHTRNDTLTAAEIAARKKAHADRHASKGKNKGGSSRNKQNSKKKEPAAGKQSSQKRPKNGEKKPSSAARKNAKPRGSAEEKPMDMEDFRRARSRIKAKKRAARLGVLLAIAVAAAAIYFTRGLWVPKLEGILDKPRETIVNDSTEQSGNFPLDTGDSTVLQITRLDGSIITADGSHITSYDTNGKLRESIYHGCGSPEIRSLGKRMLCFDFGGTAFKLYSKSGLVFEKQLGSTVLLGDIAANGNVMIVSEDSKYTVKVNVYDKNGEEIYQWSNGDRVSDAHFSSDGSSLLVTTFSAADGRISSVIHKINITQSGIVSDSDRFDGFIMSVCENSEGNIWAMGQDKLWLLSSNCRSLDSYEFSTEPVSFALSQSCACAACDNLSGGTTVYTFNSESPTLKPKLTESATGTVKRVRCFDDMAFVLSSDKLDAYSPDGTLISTASVSNDHIDFVWSENAAYFIDRQEVSKLIFKT